MLRTMIWSFKKSRRLQKISSKLAPRPDGGESFMRSFAEGGFESISPRLEQLDVGMQELFDLVRQDPVTSRLLEDFKVDDQELNNIYRRLVTHGAGIMKKGHWIPASTLVYGQTFRFVLSHRDDDSEAFRKVCFRLYQYFSSNETGEIQNY